MRPDVTRQSLASTCLLSALLLLLFWVRAELAPDAAESGYRIWLNLWGDGGTPWYGAVFYMMMALLNAMLAARIATRNMVFVTRTFQPIIFFVMVSCAVYMPYADPGAMLCAWLFIVGSQFLIESFRHKYGFESLLKGGIAIGIMPLLWPPAMVMWSAVPVALALFRRTWREGIVAFAGLLLPVAVYCYAEWFGGGEFTGFFVRAFEYISAAAEYSPLAMDIGRMVLVCLIVLVVFLSVGAYLGIAHSMRTRPARIIIYFICMAVAGLSLFLLPCRSVAAYPVVAVSLALISPVFFVQRRGLVPALIYILLIVCASVMNLFPILAASI